MYYNLIVFLNAQFFVAPMCAYFRCLQINGGYTAWSKIIKPCCYDITSYRVLTFIGSHLGTDRAASVVDIALSNLETPTRAALVNLQSHADFSGTKFYWSIRKKVDGDNQDAEFSFRTYLNSFDETTTAYPPRTTPLTGCRRNRGVSPTW